MADHVEIDPQILDDLVAAPAPMKLKNVQAEIAFGMSKYTRRDFLMRRMWRFYHKKHYDPQDNVQSFIDGFRDINLTSDTDHNEEEWKSTLNVPTNTIDVAKLMLTGEQPVIEALNRKTNTASRKKATRVEQFLYGMYQVNNLRQGRNIFGDAVFNSLLYGWGVFKLVWDPTRAGTDLEVAENALVDTEEVDDEEFVDRPNEDYPLVLTAPFPMTIYGVPGGRDEPFKAVFQVNTVDWEQLAQILPAQFHKRIPKSFRGPDDELQRYMPGDRVTYTDFWREVFVQDAKTGKFKKQIWHAILVNDRFVKPPTYMREYEFIPYTIFPCVADTDPDNGENWGHSFLYKVLEPIKNLEALLNQHYRTVEVWADPTVIIKTDEESPPIFSKLSGAINYMATDEDASILQWQGSPPDVQRLITFYQEEIQEMAFPGPGLGKFAGEQAGIATLAQQRAALSKIQEPQKNLEMALDRLHTKAISLLQRWSKDESISVRGSVETDNGPQTFAFDLKGSQTKGMRYTETKVRARFPLDELQNAATAGSVLQQKAFSKKAVMRKFYFIRDPEGMSEEIRDETATDDLGWLKIMQGVLEKKFVAADERRAERRAQQGEAGVAAPAVPPSTPGAPPGRPPIPTAAPGAVGRGQPGTPGAAFSQVAGDIATQGQDGPAMEQIRAAIAGPASGGEGVPGVLRNLPGGP